MTGADEFHHHDGAYVLGALDDADRDAFEAHLPGCAECRGRVAEARAAMLLLAAAGPRGEAAGAVGDSPDALPDTLLPDTLLPDTLLPGLLRRAEHERRRRRVVAAGTGVLAGLAAACLAVLAIVFWPSGDRQQDRPDPPRAFVAVRPNPVEASAQLVGRRWGTQIDLRCRYKRDLQPGTTYRLVVVDVDRRRFDAGGWTLGEGTTDFVGGTEVPRDRIAAVQVTLADGRPILQLTP
ncbi:Putative zinc-finger [Jatrophihabitans endophyticus]|uniref:Putative zinc-finger n=1 Tax=Jatrophihabitans endophyticus TaxID=1206085 RepID=A0A1M5MTC1_9ACTN|nr:zf-HC2 domain-containing protein [Jatrophihabitans endophyticus]SHG80506.1 Putative zinc-finger [Jatrophihabitans endophyticus]